MLNQFILVVYDISNDRRRTKLHNLLLNYGTPVQYSVFECLLDENQIRKMKAAIRKIINPRKDNLRYYWLCAHCVKKIEAQGGDIMLEPPQTIIV